MSKFYGYNNIVIRHPKMPDTITIAIQEVYGLMLRIRSDEWQVLTSKGFEPLRKITEVVLDNQNSVSCKLKHGALLYHPETNKVYDYKTESPVELSNLKKSTQLCRYVVPIDQTGDVNWQREGIERIVTMTLPKAQPFYVIHGPETVYVDNVLFATK